MRIRYSHIIQRIPYLELLFVGFIIGVTVWGYYDTLDDFFIMDDFDMIQGHSTFRQFLKHWVSPVGANSYRPLIDLLFIWDFYWWKWNPVGWHLSDLIFHIINSLLVYAFTKQLLKNSSAGLVAGVLFGLHTCHTEAVTWISARMDVVCTTFFLLSVLYFILSTGDQASSLVERKKQKRRYILSLVFFACALLIKEMAVTLPLIVVLYDLSTRLKTGPFDKFRTGFTFLTKWKAIKAELWKKIKIYTPYFLIFLIYFVIRAIVVSGAHQYSSESRSLFGGYDVKLFGSFIFENIVSYFEFLAIPFVEEIFPASLVINLVIIGIVTFVCLAFSTESRFAILWIFVTLLPVYSFNIGRGGYLASVGFCVLMGMLLTFGFERARTLNPKKTSLIATMFRVAQILIILLLFYRYGIALNVSNAWWSGVAEINEKVPLLVKSLYPTFPDQSKVCLQNVPLVLNQRFHSAFQFHYPDVHFRGIYVEDFERCAASETGNLLQSTYFFHYDENEAVVYDLTYETREKMADQHAIYIQKLFRNPSHELSREHPQLQVELEKSALFSSIGIVTSLANGGEVPQKTVIARGQVEGENGRVETFELVAGQNTAEWAIRFPDLQGMVKHTMPQVYRAWTVRQPDETIVIAQNYIKKVKFQRFFAATKFFLEFIPSSDLPSDLMLDVDRIIFYGDKGSE